MPPDDWNPTEEEVKAVKEALQPKFSKEQLSPPGWPPLPPALGFGKDSP